MAENSSFRSAIKGFNREDVVSYISGLMEKISTGEKDMETLREKLSRQEREAEGLRKQYDALEKERNALSESCAKLEKERDEQAKRCAALERRCMEFDSLSKSTEVKLGAAMLDAKRFSEMLVQEASERAGGVYQDAYQAVTASSLEARGIEKQMKELTDLFEKSMGELRRNMRDLIGRMTDFGEEVKDNGIKFAYRSDFSEEESE